MYIIPKPQSMTLTEEKILVNSVVVTADCPKVLEFAQEISDPKGEVCVTFAKDEALSKEQYRLTVAKEGIAVTYGTAEGAFRGVTTLKQILDQREEGMLPCLEICDGASIDNRGYMLDISRGKIPSLEYLKKFVDILADLKYNQLQLYMESFVYEYKNFPDYWKDTEPLKASELKELEEYCQKKFIKLVPNQNGFGHMAAWTRKPELSHLAITGKTGQPSATLNPLLPESLEFMDKVYDGFLDTFSADMINIGMDEPFELGLNETKEICEKLGVGRVYTDYLNKICKLILEKYHKIPMFWDDIIFKHPEELENIPKEAIVMEWGYETEQHFDRNCRRLQERGLRFYVCPGSSTWGSFTGRTNNAIRNITDSAETGNYYGAEGFLLTEWGDGGHPQFPAVSYFPLIVAAAASWNCGNHNHEIAYEERRHLLADCKSYLDTYLFHSKGEKSLADIAYRMGNYYLQEDCLQFNNTDTSWYLRTRREPTAQEKAGFLRVKTYMQGLKAELAQVEADEISKAQLDLNADMVITAAELLVNGKSDATDKEILRICEKFERLWMMDNHHAGVNVFQDFFKTYLQ